MTAAGATAKTQFNGTWRGAFKGQAVKLMPDGSFPETVHKFELHLVSRHGITTGWLVDGSEKPITRRRIVDVGRFGDRLCFDVRDVGVDMRWCVSINKNHMYGSWSLGPQGGPLLNGMGSGLVCAFSELKQTVSTKSSARASPTMASGT